MNSELACVEGHGRPRPIGSANDCDASIGGCGHDTHVSGVAAGNNTNRQTGEPANGVARNGGLITINVKFTNASSCSGAPPCILSFNTDQIKGPKRVYALRNAFNIAAINTSLGGGQKFAPCDDDGRKPIIDHLKAAGIATLIAAGIRKTNSNTGVCLAPPAAAVNFSLAVNEIATFCTFIQSNGTPIAFDPAGTPVPAFLPGCQPCGLGECRSSHHGLSVARRGSRHDDDGFRRRVQGAFQARQTNGPWLTPRAVLLYRAAP